MSKLRILRGAVLSAGIMAALLGSMALAPSAYAQAIGYGYAADALDHSYRPDAGAPPTRGWGPNYGGWAPSAEGNNVPGVSTPYWLGAPQTLGPG